MQIYCPVEPGFKLSELELPVDRVRLSGKQLAQFRDAGPVRFTRQTVAASVPDKRQQAAPVPVSHPSSYIVTIAKSIQLSEDAQIADSAHKIISLPKNPDVHRSPSSACRGSRAERLGRHNHSFLGAA
jgi:hypothetical protein